MKISFPKQKLKTSSNHPFSGLKLSPFLPPPKVRDNRPHQPQLPEDLWDSQMENKPHTNQLTIIKSTIPQWFIVENRGDSFDVRTCQANPFVETTCTSSFWPVHSRKDVKLKSSLSEKTNDICWSLSLYDGSSKVLFPLLALNRNSMRDAFCFTCKKIILKKQVKCSKSICLEKKWFVSCKKS